MEQCAATLTQGRHFRALKIHLPVERHQDLHGLQLLISGGKAEALVHEFIRKVLDGVSKSLYRAPRPGADAATMGAWRWRWYNDRR